jgi:hypothetical protein
MKFVFLAALSAFAVIFTGCLNAEYKEYRFKVNPDGSGTGTITFVNLVSQDDNGKDVSQKDFSDLVSDYLTGSGFEEANPGYAVTGKRLYEKDGKLMGEIAFTFTSLDSFGFFHQSGCACCPVLLYSKAFDDSYAATNGKFLGDNSTTPFIVWEPGIKEFYLKTSSMGDLANTHPLLALWQDWKSKGQKDKE